MSMSAVPLLRITSATAIPYFSISLPDAGAGPETDPIIIPNMEAYLE